MLIIIFFRKQNLFYKYDKHYYMLIYKHQREYIYEWNISIKIMKNSLFFKNKCIFYINVYLHLYSVKGNINKKYLSYLIYFIFFYIIYLLYNFILVILS